MTIQSSNSYSAAMKSSAAVTNLVASDNAPVAKEDNSIYGSRPRPERKSDTFVRKEDRLKEIDSTLADKMESFRKRVDSIKSQDAARETMKSEDKKSELDSIFGSRPRPQTNPPVLWAPPARKSDAFQNDKETTKSSTLSSLTDGSKSLLEAAMKSRHHKLTMAYGQDLAPTSKADLALAA